MSDYATQEDLAGKANKSDLNVKPGKVVTGSSFIINEETVTAVDNAEVFNNISTNKAVGSNSHAEGYCTVAVGEASHAEGSDTITFGNKSHAEGYCTVAVGEASHAEGEGTIASGSKSHAEGHGHVWDRHITGDANAKAYQINSLTNMDINYVVVLNGIAAIIVSIDEEASVVTLDKTLSTSAVSNKLVKIYSHAAYGSYSHAEGDYTTASGHCSHAEGYNTTASGGCSHTEGNNTIAYGDESHAEGSYTVALGRQSHVEGGKSVNSLIRVTGAAGTIEYRVVNTNEVIPRKGEVISYNGVFAEITNVSDDKSVITLSRTLSITTELIEVSAILYTSVASGEYSHAEGSSTIASGDYSHAEGYNTTASGDYAHAEGIGAIASGRYTHAEGSYTTASGAYSHAEGMNTTASSKHQHVQGKCNIKDANEIYAHIVGNGDAITHSNAHTLEWQGNAWFQGDVFVGSTSGKNKDEGSKKLATETYVNESVASLVNSAPDKLNTLNELAAALGDDENFANTITTELSKKANKSEGAFFVEGSGTTDATAKTSTWIGTCDRITEYYDGLTIRYKIGVAGQTTITLNINGLGAKTVYRFNTTKLTTQFPVGSIINLIYHTDLNGGCWITNDYDANTNTYQRLYSTTTNAEYPITTRYATTTGNSYYAEYGRYSTGVTLNPSTKTITATAFKGKLTGNADTATKATQDASGNVITETYATKTYVESLIDEKLAEIINAEEVAF